MKNTYRITIVPFEEKYTRDFKRLNLEWLEGFKLLESEDLVYLDNPVQKIINPGGRILMAMDGDQVVGTSAIIVKDEKVFELAKLAVSKDAQGIGIGRMLVLETLKQAKEMGAKVINLVSNSKLSAAICLYESLGFEHAPLPKEIAYETADIYMELKISD